MLCIGDLVGRPYVAGGRDPETGLDCWGLVREVLRRQGVVLPAYGEHIWHDDSDSAEVAEQLLAGAADWQPAPIGPSARPGDVALIMLAGRPVHVGVLIAWPDFLHAYKGAGTVVIDRLTSPAWRHRCVGLYRHPALVAPVAA